MSDFLIGCGLFYLGVWKFMIPSDFKMDMIKNPSLNSDQIIRYLIGWAIAGSGVLLILNFWDLPFSLIQISPSDPDSCSGALRRVGLC